jgi:hypothetical protein
MARGLWAVAAGVLVVSACGTPMDREPLSTTDVAPLVTPLADLPAWHPAVEGTVDLLTYAARVDGGMAALIRLTLQYNAAGNCLYADVDGQRYAVVWPFGYSATESDGSVTVFDPRGDQVAVTGEPIELGGGNDSGVGDGGAGGWVDRGTTGSSCDAKAFWIVNNG